MVAKTIRVKAFIATLGMFGYIIAVAVTKQVIAGLIRARHPPLSLD